jgi:hypothetical protein
VEQQHGQRGALLLPAKWEDAIPFQDLQRAENPELQDVLLPETRPAT